MDNLYLILDESGNLHKNSKNRYFIIGGYLTNNALKARQLFRKELSTYKSNNNLNSISEIKGSMIKNSNKKTMLLSISNKMLKNNFYIPVFIVIDKNNLEKPIENVNILYNYFIKLLVKRLATLNLITSQANLIIKLDNKTIKVGSINTLEEYLQGEFYFDTKINLDKVYYVDSANNFEIQLADFICNYYWRCYERENTQIINIKFMKVEILYFPMYNFGI
ncbi:hypothetical protein CI111_04545 [Fusobacterium animalis]|uniref:DUF3800 domain-containing protein n=1 Tax=Fusobacterium animalis TaxID=76859 RepID=A0A2G9FB92_9FUSO|nr:DUF3800 domain-containing protein [Fusobacterium animalis]PIM90171.1 hypothetical protein CI114_07200 [Fusobacterium animalis]PIM93925.1 hypothetical protein CI111_04545 [Fusobacterium animalis]